MRLRSRVCGWVNLQWRRASTTRHSLPLQTIEVVVERVRVVRAIIWRQGPLVAVHKVLHSGAVGPTVNFVAPVQASVAEEPPRLQLVLSLRPG